MRLTTANAAGTNGLTYLPTHGGARNNNFLVTHPMTDQRCLTSATTRRSALTAEPSSSCITYCFNNLQSISLLLNFTLEIVVVVITKSIKVLKLYSNYL
jgi:hypothetical protein